MGLEEVNPIIDFIDANKFAGEEVATENGTVCWKAPWPDFSMKGRTLKSILRLARAWHSGLSMGEKGRSFSWAKSGIQGYRFLEKRVGEEKDREWSIQEILESGALQAEGRAMLCGGVRGHFFGQSSFATHALATMRNLVKVPKSLPLELLAPLGCGLQTGAGTVINSLAVRAGASIAVFGTGSVGLAAVMAARIVKAKTIIAVDINPRRLTLACELGATHSINNRRSDLAGSIKAITGSGVDYIVESTADHEMEQFAAKLLNPGGKAALLSGASARGGLPGERQVLSVIQGDAVPQKFIPKLIKLYQEGRFPFDRLVKFYDFTKINRAIADSKRGSTIKPVLLISSEAIAP